MNRPLTNKPTLQPYQELSKADAVRLNREWEGYWKLAAEETAAAKVAAAQAVEEKKVKALEARERAREKAKAKKAEAAE
jgi:hypothetical protein